MRPLILSDDELSLIDVSTKIRALKYREQYCSCHVYLPNESQRVAAIYSNDKFYILLKVVNEPKKALKICHLLEQKGREIIFTKTVKGLALWLWEPEAYANEKTQSRLKILQQRLQVPACKILKSPRQYQYCSIRTKDSAEPSEAIQVDGKYYSLVMMIDMVQQALELAVKLHRRGNDVIITQTAFGNMIWVLQPEAVLA